MLSDGLSYCVLSVCDVAVLCQTVGWIKMKLGLQVRLSPGMGTQLSLPKGAQPPNFRPISVVAKWLDGLRCNLVWR